MGSKKLLPHISTLEGPSSIYESMQANNRSEFSDKIYWQATQCLRSHIMQQPSSLNST